MAFCPICRRHWEDGATECPICGRDLSDIEDDGVEWVVLGYLKDKLSADLARDVLLSSDIPAVLFSKSGFFGNIGLPLNPIYGGRSAAFEISVPKDYEEEAAEVLDAVLSGKWSRRED